MTTDAAEQTMTANQRIAYNFAVLRVVPDVATGAFINVGVILHARTAGFLDLRLLDDADALRARISGVAPDPIVSLAADAERARIPGLDRELDLDLLRRYLHSIAAICRGASDAGPIALVPSSERFHWLTAPRSDVLQSSPVHEGITDDPARTLAELFACYVQS